jgi:hypothetical protein
MATHEQEDAKNATAKANGGGTVYVIGGSGGLSSRYRDVVEAKGLSLKHVETKFPSSLRRNVGKIALVVVMVGMVSHALRDQVRQLSSDAPVVYLPSASVSALKSAVESRLG